MKILVLGSRIPYPLHDGGAIATFGMLREMAAQGADVTYFTYNTMKHFVPDTAIGAHFGFCRVIAHRLDTGLRMHKAFQALISGKNYNISRFENAEANARLAELLQQEQFDIIHFEGLYSVPFLDTVLEFAPNTVRTLRQHNAEFYIWEKLADGEKNILKKWYLNYLAKGLKKYEVTALNRFENVICISRSDEQLFRNIHQDALYFYYPAGMEIPDDLPSEVQPQSLYHIGSMEWMPNVDGVTWFLKEIWPDVRRLWPHATFHLAGKGLMHDDPRFIAEGVSNHGEVPDAIQFQRSFEIMVVPLHSGSGLRMKTVEAMALSKPVISTAVGAEGIRAENGINILIANEPTAWISAISDLFNNPGKAESLGVKARETVLKEYSVKERTAELLAHYHRLLQKNG